MVLLKVLKKLKLREKELRVLILGLDNAGKTTLMKRCKGESIEEVSPTLGFEIETLEYEGYSLHVWDIGGQKSIRSYWRNHFEQTDALIWVVDSSDRHRLQVCADELSSLLGEERLGGANLLVFANKQDIEGALSPAEIADALQLDKVKRRHWHICGCSAKDGKGLEEGLKWVVQDAASRVFLLQ
mmetsp:Transcript_5739/g.17583  ORF Transcript_5739/g.17583 Transcript_5739/m.17583 type:complete len:185 (-) Transcript_5739:15-569(-)|eukprot:CAMPEP_0177646560 /NCGR_PEP_ID=MMETSP0447-20121125/9836_1 /TAXON_ID=0 /ORGANISM="Stygamoeba regulata, Strain BSH-02190019" /LENGTH=184 /DNA_ID=CAMNT_0019149095 /DNA_START=109 /DNA_END=663 /DNA_ORIENTATION=+